MIKVIKITLGQLRDRFFVQAFSKIANDPSLEFKAKYHIGRVAKLVDSELKAAETAFTELVDKYADWELDEKGNKKTWKIPPEKMDEWTKVTTEFAATEVTIDKHKFLPSWIENAKISANEILALDPLINNLEVIEGGQDGKTEAKA